MTVYQPIIEIAETAAELAVPIAQGEEPPADLASGQGGQRREAGAVGAARHDRDPGGQHRGPVVKEGFLDVGRHLHRRVREGVQGGRPAVTPAARSLAVDAGQTEIRAALSDVERGPRSATAPGVLRMGRWVGPEEVAEALLAARGGAAVRCRSRPARRRRAVRLRGGGRGGPPPRGRAASRAGSRSSVWRSRATGVTSLLGALGRPRRRGGGRRHRDRVRGAPRRAAGEGRRLGHRCSATPAAASRSGARASTRRCAMPTAAAARRRCCGRPSAATRRCRSCPSASTRPRCRRAPSRPSRPTSPGRRRPASRTPGRSWPTRRASSR